MPKSLIACLLPLFIITACQPRTKEGLFNKGVNLLEKGDARSAVIYLKDALDKDRGYTEARLYLAEAYDKLGKLEAASNELNTVLKANPSLKNAHIELARIYLEQSKPDIALAEIKKIPNAETDPQALEETGWAYALKADYPTALASLDKALSAGGNEMEIGLRVARVYFQMGDMAKTKGKLLELLKKAPDNRDALHMLASVQIKQNDINGALQTYARAGKSDIQAQFNAGLLLTETNRNDQAGTISEQLISAWPHRPEGYVLKGIALFDSRKFGEATGFLQKALTMADIPGAHYYLGLCMYDMNEFEQALDQLNRAINLDPSLAPAQNLIGLILIRQKRTDEAIAHMKKFIASGGDTAAAHSLLGNAYIAKGMYSEGMAELNRANALDPSFINAHVEKGILLLGSGKLPEAETELKTAVSLNPDVLNTRLLLASYYMKRGEFDKALDLLRKGLKGGKTDAPLYDLMGKIFAAQNKLPEALASLVKAASIAPDYPDSYFDLAALYVQMGQTGKAAQEMEVSCQKIPGDIRALLYTASLLEAGGDNAKAQNYYSLAAQSGRPEGYLALAEFYMRQKRTDYALSTLDSGISKNPSVAALYELKGGILLGNRNLDGAVKTYKALEKIDPKASQNLILNAYAGAKKPEIALDLIKKQLAATPGDFQAMTQLSGIYMVMGRQPQALEAARQIINMSPASPVGYMQLALIQSATSPDAAIATLKTARVPKNPAVNVMLGNLYFGKKAYPSALNEYVMAEKLKPDYIDAIYKQGVTLQAMGKNAQAAVAYQKVLGLAPRSLSALNNLAYIYAASNRNIAAAMQLASLAYISAPRNADIADTYGFVLLKGGQVPQALGILQKASMLSPGNPSILYHLALAYAQHGDRGVAISNLEKCLGMGNFPEAGQARALLSKLGGPIPVKNMNRAPKDKKKAGRNHKGKRA